MIKYSLVVFFLARPNLPSDPRSKTGKLLNVFNMVVVNFPNDDCVSDSGSRGETENGDPAQTPNRDIVNLNYFQALIVKI